MRLTVATFNIHHGEGRDGRIDLTRTASTLAAIDADLVALQELDRGLPRSASVDQVGTLEELTGMVLHFWPTLKHSSGSAYGIALAARVPLETKFVELPHSRGERRGAIVATVHGLTLIATHLAKADPDRALQTRRLADLAGVATAPVVIAGDLNQSRRSLAPLLRAGFTTGPRRPMGWGSHWWLGRQIDFVLAGPGLDLAEVHTLPTDASDHWPTIATVISA